MGCNIRELAYSSVSALSHYSQEQLREHLDPVSLAEIQGELITPPDEGDTDDTSDINNDIIQFYNSMIISLYFLLCIRQFMIILDRKYVLVFARNRG